MTAILECDHRGYALWLDHARWACLNCGYQDYVPENLGTPEAHRKGDWVKSFYNEGELLAE